MVGSVSSCTRYLDAVPDKTLIIPNTLEDLQSLLDAYAVLNDNYPSAIEIMSDDYYLTTPDWQSLSNTTNRDMYVWKRDEQTNREWGVYGNQIKYANMVLDQLYMLETNVNTVHQDAIEGSALFFRGYGHFLLSQLFGQPYRQETAESELGIPLRLTSDFNVPSYRSSVKETYESIIDDLQTAASLLSTTSLVKTRPTKAAAYGALAKVFLTMQKYQEAGEAAAMCIELLPPDHLINYNELDILSEAPFERFNKEVIFHCTSGNSQALQHGRARIDSTLYRSYSDHDLRRIAYFSQNEDGSFSFKGDYDGRGTRGGIVFFGVTVDEAYLILAESLIRIGQREQGLDYLYRLLETRWRTGTFVKPDLAEAVEALSFVLNERRKELLFRGTRWSDLRRLKDDTDFSVTPVRRIDGEIHLLEPNNPSYTLKIPGGVIAMTQMPQNP